MATIRWRRTGQVDGATEPPADQVVDDPGTIRRALAKRIKGQSDQLWRISVLLSLHLRRPAQVNAGQVSPNAVVIGPTGCGKTHTFRVADDILGRSGQFRRPGDALDLAERGILFFDEFDKIRGESSDSSLSVQNRHVQRRLLKICEGAT